MNINLKIFKAYDVRGTYPDEINEEAVYLIAKALVKFLNAKSVVVARDMRFSSEKLYQAVLKGLGEAGTEIFDVGLASTPMHTFVVNLENADGGIMVTASHNPAKYNGLKLEGKSGISICEGAGMEGIKEIVLKGDLNGEKSRKIVQSKIIRKDYLKKYTDFLTDKFSSEDFSDLEIAVDAGNGMAGFILPELFKKLKIKYHPLYFELDGFFPHHEADPTKPKNLKDLSTLITREKLSLGAAFDGDADRVAFVDGGGKPVPIDFISAALAKSFLSRRPGSKIIYGASSSRIVRETIEENGGTALVCRTGHSFFKHLCRKEKVYFGCETSGHCFFEDFFYADSGILTMLYVLNLVKRTNQKIEDLVAPFNKYFSSGEINFEIENKAGAINALEKKYSGGILSHFDGLSVEYPDWWFNIRPSNTEPVLRLNIEARTSELLEEKKKEILEKIKSL